ncbi:MAG: hypothetical protein OEY56_10890 [Cyclobacteriaceae bacterium]|nr:hypothetical protein [Cyclobacteriaceae bacterium]
MLRFNSHNLFRNPGQYVLFGLFFFFLFFTAYGQEQSQTYTEWVKQEYEVSYTNIQSMVEKIWGNTDAKKTGLLVEMQCRALYMLFDAMNKKDANWEYLVQALDKWSVSTVEDRSDKWWEWPHTNWMKVESEYYFLLDTNQ